MLVSECRVCQRDVRCAQHLASTYRLVSWCASSFLTARSRKLPDAAWRHACQNFGILFAGGVLAREAWLLPVEPNDLLQILGNVFRDAARAQLGGVSETVVHRPGDDPSAVLSRTLLELKRERKLAKRVAGSTFGSGSGLAGYWETSGGRIVYTMHTASLRKALGSDERPDAILLFLRDRKALIGQKSSKAPKQSLIQLCETSPRWPDGRNVRSLVFFQRTRSRPKP